MAKKKPKRTIAVETPVAPAIVIEPTVDEKKKDPGLKITPKRAGRPKSADTVPAVRAAAKKKGGRPKGSKNKAKSRMGRPKGSRNKPKLGLPVRSKSTSGPLSTPLSEIQYIVQTEIKNRLSAALIKATQALEASLVN